MGRKCSVFNCKSGYPSSQRKVKVYQFPSDEVERSRWISSLPNSMNARNVTKWMGVCELHWPADTPKDKKNRFLTPSLPPSIFHEDSYMTSTPTPTFQPSQEAPSAVFNPVTDILSQLLEKDCLNAKDYLSQFKEKFHHVGLIAQSDTDIFLFSTHRKGSVHNYSLYFQIITITKGPEDKFIHLKYEAFSRLKKIVHPSLPNPITNWSQLEALVQFVTSYAASDCDETIQVPENSLQQNMAPCLQMTLDKGSQFNCVMSHYSLGKDNAQQEINCHLKMEEDDRPTNEEGTTLVTENEEESLPRGSVSNLKMSPTHKGSYNGFRTKTEVDDDTADSEIPPKFLFQNGYEISAEAGWEDIINQDKGLYTCGECSTSFPTELLLQSHIAKDHLGLVSGEISSSSDPPDGPKKMKWKDRTGVTVTKYEWKQ